MWQGESISVACDVSHRDGLAMLYFVNLRVDFDRSLPTIVSSSPDRPLFHAENTKRIKRLSHYQQTRIHPW
jgi:hypothetical protein